MIILCAPYYPARYDGVLFLWIPVMFFIVIFGHGSIGRIGGGVKVPECDSSKHQYDHNESYVCSSVHYDSYIRRSIIKMKICRDASPRSGDWGEEMEGRKWKEGNGRNGEGMGRVLNHRMFPYIMISGDTPIRKRK